MTFIYTLYLYILYIPYFISQAYLGFQIDYATFMSFLWIVSSLRLEYWSRRASNLIQFGWCLHLHPFPQVMQILGIYLHNILIINKFNLRAKNGCFEIKNRIKLRNVPIRIYLCVCSRLLSSITTVRCRDKGPILNLV